MGPTLRPTGRIERLEDGRILHVFRQSSLNEAELCMEKGRRLFAGELPRWETDGAAIGTAVHAGIEFVLRDQLDGYEISGGTFDVALEVAHMEFSDITRMENFRWISGTEEKARAAIDRCFTAWSRLVWPKLTPVAVEVPFDGVVLHEDDERVIQLQGTIDYIDAAFGLGDWKTASQRYKRWEKQRWAIQPTVYTYAARALEFECAEVDVVPFTFYVMNKSGKQLVDIVSVSRHEGDWQWLRAKALAVSRLIEADLSEWPKQDDHALCSPKWCPAWGDCKGRHYAEGWPEVSLPRGGSSSTQ